MAIDSTIVDIGSRVGPWNGSDFRWQSCRRARVFYIGNAQMRYHGIDQMGYPWATRSAGLGRDRRVLRRQRHLAPERLLSGKAKALAPLRLRKPVAKIGWSRYVYDPRRTRGAAARH
jgi:hypothetical protein